MSARTWGAGRRRSSGVAVVDETMIPTPRRLAPTLAEIEAMGRAALAAIPDPWRRHIGDIVIRVEDFCDEETERSMALESPFELLGQYRGVALPDKSSAAVADDLDVVFLYRRPILDFWCETGDDLDAIIRHLVVHEVGHHFGFSDEEMERIEDGEG